MSLALIISLIAAVSVLMTRASLAGFQSSSKSTGEPTWWFFKGFSAMALAANARGLYWDVFWTWLKEYDYQLALDWSDASGGTAVNVLFYIPMLYGSYCMLKCRQLMIPEDERHMWPWYLAWRHPENFRLFRWPRNR